LGRQFDLCSLQFGVVTFRGVYSGKFLSTAG
jgi:hypothetical protein